MNEFLINAHDGWQYVAGVFLLGALVMAYRGSELTTGAERVYRVTLVVFDIQVGLGLAVWFATSAWDSGFLQGWLHPLVGLAALGVLHVFIGRARKADAGEANVIARRGLILAIALVVVAIVTAELA